MPVCKAQAPRIYTYHLGIAAQLLLLLMGRAHLGPKQEFLSISLFPSTVFHRDVRNTRLYYSLTHRGTLGDALAAWRGNSRCRRVLLPWDSYLRIKHPGEGMNPSRRGKCLDFHQNGRGKRLRVRLTGVGWAGRATPGGRGAFNGITTATRLPIKSC